MCFDAEDEAGGANVVVCPVASFAELCTAYRLDDAADDDRM